MALQEYDDDTEMVKSERITFMTKDDKKQLQGREIQYEIIGAGKSPKGEYITLLWTEDFIEIKTNLSMSQKLKDALIDALGSTLFSWKGKTITLGFRPYSKDGIEGTEVYLVKTG